MSCTELISAEELLKSVRKTTEVAGAWGRRRAASEGGLGRDPNCAPGCAWCCQAKVVIDVGQGATIALHLMAEGRWTPALVDRLTAADRAMSPISHFDWNLREVPCTFLNSDGPGRGECSIYPVRPIACMLTFGSRTGDPSDCRLNGEANLVMVIPGQHEAELLVRYPHGLLAASEERHWITTIPGAVLYGAAMLTESPRPDVFKIELETKPEGMEIEHWFDTAAAAHVRPPIQLGPVR